MMLCFKERHAVVANRAICTRHRQPLLAAGLPNGALARTDLLQVGGVWHVPPRVAHNGGRGMSRSAAWATQTDAVAICDSVASWAADPTNARIRLDLHMRGKHVPLN